MSATKVKSKKAPVSVLTREEWLLKVAHAVKPLIEMTTEKMTPPFRISVGFPSRGALSAKQRVHGQCFHKHSSKDGVFEVFVTPLIEDPVEVAGVVAHELIHANDENENKHNHKFATIAHAIGLTGKPTATKPGEKFKEFIAPVLKEIGPYPHGGMQVSADYKPQPTRLLKACCPVCNYTVRVTKMWVETVGLPICPVDEVGFVMK